MTNEFMCLQNILCFLSLFNLKVEERVFRRNIKDVLYSKRPILLFDETENKVGKIYIEDGNLIIKANLDDKTLRAVGNNSEDKDLYCFDYVITKNNKDRLVGHYNVEKEKVKKGVIVKNSVSLYENDFLSLSLTFNPIKNKIKIDDSKNKIKVRYINNEFLLEQEDLRVFIRDDNFGHITYSLDKKYNAEKEEKKERIYGYSNIGNKGYKEKEFGFILREIYEGYFVFLQEKKDSINDYGTYLFEKLSCMSLKFLNKEKLTSLLDINFNEFKGTSFQKKKQSK